MTNAHFATAASYLQRGIEDKRRELEDLRREIDDLKRATTEKMDRLNLRQTNKEREAASTDNGDLRIILLKKAQELKSKAENKRQEMHKAVDEMNRLVRSKEDEIRSLETEVQHINNIAARS